MAVNAEKRTCQVREMADPGNVVIQKQKRLGPQLPGPKMPYGSTDIWNPEMQELA